MATTKTAVLRQNISAPARPVLSLSPTIGVGAQRISLDVLRQATRNLGGTLPPFVPPGTVLARVPGHEGPTTVAQPLSRKTSLEFPLRCIGRVGRKKPGKNWGFAGSGVLIGPWHLLTASHVINGDEPGTIYNFTPAYFSGNRSGEINVRWFEANIIGHIGIDIDAVAGFDYVVCELDSPLGLDWGWLTYGASNKDEFYTNVTWTSVGYPNDLGGKEPYFNYFIVYEVEDDDNNSKEIRTQGDTHQGWSGGPLYGPSLLTGTKVVGVLSGGREGSGPGDPDRDVFAGGPDMVNLVNYARDNWKRWYFAAGDPTAYLHQGGNGPVQHVVYRGEDSHIHELFALADGWFANTLTGAAQAPLAAGDPFGYLHQGTSGPIQHVVYRGQDKHIHELYTSGNNWVFNTLTISAQAPLAAGDPFGYLHQGAAGPVQHVVYRGQDKHIHELYSSANSWMFNTLTISAQAPLAAGDPFGYLHQGPAGPIQHVVYRGQDGHIHELYTSGNKWVFNTLTISAQAPLAAGDPFGYLHQATTGPVQHVVYRSQNNDVIELYTTGSAWVFNMINISAIK